MPRNPRVQARVTFTEQESIQTHAKELGISTSKLVVEGTQLYIDVLRKQRQGLLMVFVDANGYALPSYNQTFTGVVKWQTQEAKTKQPFSI